MQDYFITFFKIQFGCSVINAINTRVANALIFAQWRKSAANIHDQVMTAMMKAPINLFYDVTPIGMIINRISSDMGVFRGHLYMMFTWMTDMSSHFVYLIMCLAFLESFTVMFAVMAIIYVLSLMA